MQKNLGLKKNNKKWYNGKFDSSLNIGIVTAALWSRDGWLDKELQKMQKGLTGSQPNTDAEIKIPKSCWITWKDRKLNIMEAR